MLQNMHTVRNNKTFQNIFASLQKIESHNRFFNTIHQGFFLTMLWHLYFPQCRL